MIKNKFNAFRRICRMSTSIAIDYLWQMSKAIRYHISFRTLKDRHKLKYSILRHNHVLEKAFSLRDTRKFFGNYAVTKLANEILAYHELYADEGNTDFLLHPLDNIKYYINYIHKNSDADISYIENIYNQLSKYYPTYGSGNTATIIVRSADLSKEARGDFRSLLFSRHSVRYFKSGPPSNDVLNEALLMASRSPSACNRQGWKTYIFKGDDCRRLMEWQIGSRGFVDDVPCAILVAADIRAYEYYEVPQAYVDGGMYAMNLIHSLRYLGVETIPLSCLTWKKELKKLKNFGIPDNEICVLIIGCGYMPEECKVAASKRLSIDETNTYVTL